MQRLTRVSTGSGSRNLLYDGANAIAEYDAWGGLIYRWVHAPGVDEPLVNYRGWEGPSRNWLVADERGSIIMM